MPLLVWEVVFHLMSFIYQTIDTLKKQLNSFISNRKKVIKMYRAEILFTDDFRDITFSAHIAIWSLANFYKFFYRNLWISQRMWYNIPSEKAMAPHSSTLAQKIPRTEEPGRLQSMGLLRVGHDWATSLSLFTFMHWRRKWQPTPVFLPGESQGWGTMVGCSLWGHTESDTTEVT